jgi:hypothetical protein
MAYRLRLNEMQLNRPRQWGACWLACVLYEQLGLDRFWASRLPNSREGTCWRHILQTLVCYRLIDPGSEWQLHRSWFAQSAGGDPHAVQRISLPGDGPPFAEPLVSFGDYRDRAA